jgi:general secretion pathway protein D
MQQANRFSPRRGRAALLATACLITPIAARELPTAASAAQREIDQRRIDIEEAKELIERGDQAYQAKRYADAVTAFSGARDLIPESPVTNDLRTATTRRLVLASIEQARTQSRKGDVEGAKATVDSVLVPSVAPNDPGALALRNQLDDPIRTNPALTKEHGADVDEVRRLLYTAEGAYNLGKFDEAKETYLKVLQVDATNTAARRGLEQVAATKSRYYKAATDQTRAEMLSQVDAAWEMPPPPALMDPSTGDLGEPGLVNAIIPMTNKLERIIIPSLILEDASLQDAIDLLRVRAAELDLIETDPARRGINFNLDIGADGSPIGDAIRAIRFDMRLSQVPIAKVLEYINQQTKTIYTTDDFSVTIRPSGVDSKDLTTRTFRVPPNFLSSLGNADAAAADADPFGAKPGNGLLTERRGVLEMLKQQGIQFPEGATASLTGGSLVVVNTPANLEIISEIVDNVVKTEPVMVCVRVTMIRTRQERLDELGFDWLLGNMGIGGGGWIPGTDILNFGGGTQGTGGNLGDMALPPGQSSSPMTSGNRSGDEAVYRDSIDGLIEATNNNTRFNTITRRGSGFCPGFKLKIVGIRMALIAHLCYYFVASGCICHQFNFVKSAPHWFFHINMFPQRHCKHGNRKMRMVGNANQNGINLVGHFVEHHPEILETRYIGKFFEHFFCVRCSHVGIAKRHNITKPSVVQRHYIRATLVANSHTGKINPFTGSSHFSKWPVNARHRFCYYCWKYSQS